MNAIKKWWNALEAKLLDNWKIAYLFLSVQLGVIATAVVTYATAFPESVSHAWLILPPEIKAVIPVNYVQYVGIALFVLSLLARLFKQKNVTKATVKLEQEKDAKAVEAALQCGQQGNDDGN